MEAVQAGGPWAQGLGRVLSRVQAIQRVDPDPHGTGVSWSFEKAGPAVVIPSMAIGGDVGDGGGE